MAASVDRPSCSVVGKSTLREVRYVRRAPSRRLVGVIRRVLFGGSITARGSEIGPQTNYYDRPASELRYQLSSVNEYLWELQRLGGTALRGFSPAFLSRLCVKESCSVGV